MSDDLPASLASRPDGYAEWLDELRGRVRDAQQCETLSVNRELVVLYWRIGQDILERQEREGWGVRWSIVSRTICGAPFPT